MHRLRLAIEIVCSADSQLSSMSLRSRAAVLAVLSKYYARVSITMVETVSDLELLAERKPDLVFMGTQSVLIDKSAGYVSANKLWISQYLDAHGIAYTGSGKLAHALENDKPLAKQRIIDSGLNTSPYIVVGQDTLFDESSLGMRYPLFIKPPNRGGGLGIDDDSVAYIFEEAKAKVMSLLAKYGSEALIEEYLPGREFSVALLRDEISDDYMVMPIELVADRNDSGVCVLSGKLKHANAERVLTLNNIVTRKMICDFAYDAFMALGARDYGRIDIRLDANGVPMFLEANLLPSLISGYGSFPKACVLNRGIQYEEMLLRIIRLGLGRAEAAESAQFGYDLTRGMAIEV